VREKRLSFTVVSSKDVCVSGRRRCDGVVIC
jgi:hypothetical protein